MSLINRFDQFLYDTMSEVFTWARQNPSKSFDDYWTEVTSKEAPSPRPVLTTRTRQSASNESVEAILEQYKEHACGKCWQFGKTGDRCTKDASAKYLGLFCATHGKVSAKGLRTKCELIVTKKQSGEVDAAPVRDTSVPKKVTGTGTGNRVTRPTATLPRLVRSTVYNGFLIDTENKLLIKKVGVQNVVVAALNDDRQIVQWSAAAEKTAKRASYEINTDLAPAEEVDDDDEFDDYE